MMTFLGGVGARPARAGDARTGQMAEFDVEVQWCATRLSAPLPYHSRYILQLSGLNKAFSYKSYCILHKYSLPFQYRVEVKNL